MELIRGLHNLQPRHRGCAATIGNFDGVHLGHQKIFNGLKERALSLNVPEVAVVFEPQPAEHFAPEQAPARLTRLREKLDAMRDCGVDRVLCLHFGWALAGTSPEDFIRRVLVEGLGVRHLSVGDDFRFGANRRGDFEHLRRSGEELGFQVERTPTVELQGARISSTRVRSALLEGDLARARELLGRAYAICGRVAVGDRIGRKIGFRTANVHLHRRLSPVKGVFVVRVQGAAVGLVDGVANIGHRPTVDGTRHQLEAHLFDYVGDLYGRHLRVELLHRIRDEQRFGSLDALKTQIHEDVDAARAWLASPG